LRVSELLIAGNSLENIKDITLRGTVNKQIIIPFFEELKVKGSVSVEHLTLWMAIWFRDRDAELRGNVQKYTVLANNIKDPKERVRTIINIEYNQVNYTTAIIRRMSNLIKAKYPDKVADMDVIYTGVTKGEEDMEEVRWHLIDTLTDTTEQKTIALPTPSEKTTVTCLQLNEILTGICQTKLTDDVYADFYRYIEPFLEYYVNNSVINACSGAKITIFYEYDKGKFANFGIYMPNYINWECKKRFLVIPLGLRSSKAIILEGAFPVTPTAKNSIALSEYLDDIKTDSQVGHRNAILIDNVNNTLELFEPHGYSETTDKIVIPAMQQLITLVPSLIGYKIIPPIEYCPRVGVQELTGDAFCSNWSLLYTILRLACPDTPKDALVTHLVSKGKEGLTQLMQSFSCWLWNYVRTNNIAPEWGEKTYPQEPTSIPSLASVAPMTNVVNISSPRRPVVLDVPRL